MPATIAVTSLGDNVAPDNMVTLREAIQSIDNGANLNNDVVAAGAYGPTTPSSSRGPGQWA
jgi:hypothetical protein